MTRPDGSAIPGPSIREGEGGTRLTGTVDIPPATSPIDPAPIEASLSEMKRLIECET